MGCDISWLFDIAAAQSLLEMINLASMLIYDDLLLKHVEFQYVQLLIQLLERRTRWQASLHADIPYSTALAKHGCPRLDPSLISIRKDE